MADIGIELNSINANVVEAQILQSNCDYRRRSVRVIIAESITTVEARNALVWFLTKFVSAAKRAPTPDRVRQRPEIPARETFISILIGQQPKKGTLAGACDWYLGFLELQFIEVWTTLLRPTLTGLHDAAPIPMEGDMAIIYRFMNVVAKSLRQTARLALSDIVDELDNDGLLKETDEDRSLPCQLVFTAIGWLSKLYHPRPDPTPQKLQIMKYLTTAPDREIEKGNRLLCFRIGRQQTRNGRPAQRETPLATGPSKTYSQSLEHHDQPLVHLLRRFGDLFPSYKSDPRVTQGSGLGTSMYAESIELSYVSFDMIRKFAKVRIEWVDCLSMHMEFDSRTKTLKVFRYPSYCRIMYAMRGESTLLSQLFKDHSSTTFQEETSQSDKDRTGEFFREVLLSYRLLFGQNSRSWKAFNKAASERNRSRDCTTGHAVEADPMLKVLCGQKWDAPGAYDLYRDVHAEDASEYYHPDANFPYLGKRILEVQHYVKMHNPRSWSELWWDRRNVTQWWAFWTVIFFGCVTLIMTLILGTLQLVFQVIQVDLARQQLKQPSGGALSTLTPS